MKIDIETRNATILSMHHTRSEGIKNISFNNLKNKSNL